MSIHPKYRSTERKASFKSGPPFATAFIDHIAMFLSRRWNEEGMGHNEGIVMVRYTMLWLSPVSPSTLCVCYEGVVLLLQRQSTNRRGSHSLTLCWIYVYLCLA